MLKKIIFLFLSWRIFLFIPLFVSQAFIAFRHGYPYASPLYFLSDKYSIVSNFLLYPWANFDGVYYLIIAANGYTESTAGFFPLFPFVINITTSIFGSVHAFDTQQYLLTLILVSLFFLTSLIMIYKLVKLDFNNNIAMLTILAMLVFPTSFFYASLYSESLFLLLSVLVFYFARRKRWILACLCGGLLTATRFVGIAIIPALIYEFVKSDPTSFGFAQLRGARKTLPKNIGKFLVRISPLLLVPTGLLIYMWFNLRKWGNPLFFIEAQGNLQNERTIDKIVFLPQTIFRYFKILSTVSPNQFEWWVALLELSTFIFTAILLYVSWKKRLRLSYIIFALICFLIPISTGTFSGLPRYSLVLFPIFIALALVRNKSFKIAYSLIATVLLFLLFMLFSKGYYIA